MENIKEKFSDICTAVYKKLSFTQILVYGYLAVILISALLLMLPASSSSGKSTNYLECVFMTTSALSGTGLVLYDTYEHWSFLGQLIILIVIQIGGIGFMSLTIFALSFTSRKIGLKSRVTMRESVAGINGGGIVKMTRFILKGTIITELIGAIVLCIFYVPRLGAGMGIFFAIFHSISAFCTAGIDLMGYFEPGSSLVTANCDLLLNLTLIILLNIGGIGFITWDDIIRHKWHFKKYRLQSKIVLFITVLFYVAALGLVLAFEWNNTLDGYSVGNKVLITSMLVTSGRDAGFAPLVVANLKQAVILVMIVLMFIGGAPGSTACGIKTTTFAVMWLTIASVFRKRKSVECFGRRIDDASVRDACCVTTLYLMVVIISSCLISGIQGLDLTEVVFEIVSAISSCGLSMGITSELKTMAQVIVIIVMFFGRIGGLTFIVSLKNRADHAKATLPEEKIMIG